MKKISKKQLIYFLTPFLIFPLGACQGAQNKDIPFVSKELADGKIGVEYHEDISIDDDEIFYEVDYDSDLPGGLFLDEEGIISGIPSEIGDFTFTIVAYNDDAEKNATFNLHIDKGTFIYTGKTLENAKEGEPYIADISMETTIKGTKYELEQGSNLPEGLVLDEEGKVSGTPVVHGDEFTFSVVASAPNYDNATATFKLKIEECEPKLPEDLGHIVFEDFQLEDGLVGTSYSQSVGKAYGVPNIKYSIKYINGIGLPKGLSFDKNLFIVYGTPKTSTVGTMRFQIIASSEGYDSVTVNVLLRIYDVYVQTTRFEAEYIDVSALTGSGYSSSPSGKNMIQSKNDFGTNEISNGYCLGYLHKSIIFEFDFTSTEAIKANLILRLGTELGDIIFNPSLLEIKINGQALDYEEFVLADHDKDSSTKDFSTIDVGEINLIKNDNVISFEIFELNEANNPYNEPLPDGTMKAKGPIFDYIELTKLSGTSEIGWRPVVSNIQGE